MHTHRVREKGARRWFVHAGNFGLACELSWRWRSGFIIDAHYGGQEYFCGWILAVSRLFFLSLRIETPFRWHRLRPFDGKYGEKARQFGIRASHGDVRLDIGHDPLGSHWFKRGRFAWFRNVWANQEITLFRWTWIVGRDRVSTEILDKREAEIIIDRWPGDRYRVTQTIDRMTWRNRFRTVSRTGYQWDIAPGQRGIPTDTNGKWGDRYSETYGFGADAPDSTDVPALLAGASWALAERLNSLLREWPEGLVPDYAS